MRHFILFILILVASHVDARAGEVRIAVAANFARTCEVLAQGFERQTGHNVRVVSGSSGKHYAQIVNGAPFDIFLSADAKRPRLLESEERTVDAIRFTYAYGRIALWSAQVDLVDADGAVLRSDEFNWLAIANPDVAPYGRAARDALGAMGLLGELQPRIVTGQSVGQVHHFVRTGNAEIGFVALAQIAQGGRAVHGSYWQVPDSFYDPIAQQAVLLTDKPSARAFLDFLKSEPSRETIRKHGYGTP